MLYCFARSYVKFQGHTGRKTGNLVLVWAFPGGNSKSNLRMAMKWHTKFQGAWKMLTIIFRSHPLHFKVTWANKRQFDKNMSKIAWPVAAITSLKFVLLPSEGMEGHLNLKTLPIAMYFWIPITLRSVYDTVGQLGCLLWSYVVMVDFPSTICRPYRRGKVIALTCIYHFDQLQLDV